MPQVSKVRIVGIDPGQDVALCLLAPGEPTIGLLLRSPGKGVDEPALRRLLQEFRPDIAYVELVGAMPGQGSTSGFTFGTCWGLIRGTLNGLSIPYKMVTPQVWKKRVLAGLNMGPSTYKALNAPKGLPPGSRKAFLDAEVAKAKAAREARKTAQKASAVDFVKAKFPTVQLIPKGCRVDNHNIAEAACIAAYGALIEIGTIHV